MNWQLIFGEKIWPLDGAELRWHHDKSKCEPQNSFEYYDSIVVNRLPTIFNLKESSSYFVFHTRNQRFYHLGCSGIDFGGDNIYRSTISEFLTPNGMSSTGFPKKITFQLETTLITRLPDQVVITACP